MESLFLSQVLGGNPGNPLSDEIPKPIGETNCELTYCDTYTGDK